MTNKIDKPPAKLTKWKIEKTQNTNISNEKGPSFNPLGIKKKIIKKYYKQLHTHKFDNLGELDQFSERHNLPKHTQGEKAHLKRLISIM